MIRRIFGLGCLALVGAVIGLLIFLYVDRGGYPAGSILAASDATEADWLSGTGSTDGVVTIPMSGTYNYWITGSDCQPNSSVCAVALVNGGEAWVLVARSIQPSYAPFGNGVAQVNSGTGATALPSGKFTGAGGFVSSIQLNSCTAEYQLQDGSYFCGDGSGWSLLLTPT